MLIINNLKATERIKITFDSGEEMIIACDRSPVCIKLTFEKRYLVERIDRDGKVIPKPNYTNLMSKFKKQDLTFASCGKCINICKCED
jgi:hypothetical protein